MSKQWSQAISKFIVKGVKGRYLVALSLFIWVNLPLQTMAIVNMHPNSRYFPAKVGCFIPIGPLGKLDCTEQLLNFEILKRLKKSKSKKNQDYLTKMILERARYFIHQQSSDYQSIVTLMVFPVEGKVRWLKHFIEMEEAKGRMNLFAQVALDRSLNRKSPYCEKKNLRSSLWEICALNIL